MVSIYITNVSGLPDPKEYPNLLENLPRERKEKTLRYRQIKDRKQSFGAGVLLQQVLQIYGRTEFQICYGTHGKPEIEGLHFNLSHSQDYVVCAVGDKAVGCDIEKIGKIREQVAKRFFTENEVVFLNCYDGEKKTEEFYRIWTMKESYMKMTGEGLSLDSKRIAFSIGETIQVYRDGERCSCFIKEYHLPGYKLTVCSEDGEFAETVEMLPCLKCQR